MPAPTHEAASPEVLDPKIAQPRKGMDFIELKALCGGSGPEIGSNGNFIVTYSRTPERQRNGYWGTFTFVDYKLFVIERTHATTNNKQ